MTLGRTARLFFGITCLLLACGRPTPAPPVVPVPLLERFPACVGQDTTYWTGALDVKNALLVDSRPELQNPPSDIRQPLGKAAGSHARVVVTFLVDTRGLTVPCAWHVVSATDPVYVPLVHTMVMGFRFVPGKIGSQVVAVVVQQAFNW